MDRAASAAVASSAPRTFERRASEHSLAKPSCLGLVAASASRSDVETGNGHYGTALAIGIAAASLAATMRRRMRRPATEVLQQRRMVWGAGRLSAVCRAATAGDSLGPEDAGAGGDAKSSSAAVGSDSIGSSSDGSGGIAELAATPVKPSPADSRQELVTSAGGKYSALTDGQKSAVSGFFFPDQEDLDMDKSMPLEDHLKEFRDGVARAGIAAVVCIGVCLTFYKELTTALEAPALMDGNLVKFVQLGPGEFFFVSVKAAVAVGLLLAFPYILFEGALYFTPALTRDERNTLGPTVLGSAVLFYAGVFFSQIVLAPAALGFFISYSADVIESQFSIDQYFEFILSMGFATGLAFQVPVLQVALGLLGLTNSEQLFSIWRYVIVANAVIGAILTPSTDPVTQLLLSGALCALYFAGALVLKLIGK